MSRVCVVIPTFNERENIEQLITQVNSALSNSGIEHQIIVVDDASPDGTGDVADRLTRVMRNLEVIHRPGKAGIGSAYKETFARVLAESSADVLCEIDSDLSHEPSALPSLVAATESGADVALGSRYVKGGKILGWPLRRRIVSKGANLLARIILGIPVKDVTSGFRAYTADALRRIDLASVRMEGYPFQVEMVQKCKQAGLKIKEVPYTFRQRKMGRSKLRRNEYFDFLKTILRLRFS